MGGHWLWHLDVPRRRREEPGVARLGAGAYCVSDLLVRNEILCSRSHGRRHAVTKSQPLIVDPTATGSNQASMARFVSCAGPRPTNSITLLGFLAL